MGDDPLVGRVLIDTYVIGRRVGEGGFGSIYEADDRELRRKVAIKTLAATRRHTPDSLERFRREAMVAGTLTHPCAVKVYDRGETDDGIVWIAMELLDGETLESWLEARGPLSPAEAVELLGPVCEVVGEAHAKGVVHRDLTPQNIVLVEVGDGRRLAKVVDFGLAAITGDDRLTDPDLVTGTPRYMAPEQWQGLRHADARADVYALGAIAYRCVSGRLPFEADSTLAWMNKHALETPVDLAAACGERAIPDAFSRAVMKALAKHPDERPQTALAFGRALRDGVSAPVRPRRRAKRVPVAAAAVVVLGAGLGLGWFATRSEPATRPAARPVAAARCDDAGARYMPMQVGNWWRHRVLNDQGQPQAIEKTTTLDRHEDIGGRKAGVAAFRLFREDASGTAIRWLSDSGSAAYWEQEEWFDLAGKPTRSVYYEDARLRIDESCAHTQVGAAWTETYDEVVIDLATGAEERHARRETWSIEAVDEPITVPAGTFRTIRIKRVFADGLRTSTYWFAPGVGKVKEASPPKEYEELTAFHVE